jgi:hypothetical protein
MPLQNRVTPFGDIVAIPQRGLFTGNRGILHDPATKTLLSKRWASKAWLTCSCDYKGIRRLVMTRRSWTELFFLDEATALAAGHRPCFLCRRDAAKAFRAAWAAGNGVPLPKAPEIDTTLHAERLQARTKRLHPLTGPIAHLPDGTMAAANGSAFMIVAGQALHWHAGGYQPVNEPPALDHLITPPSTLRALEAGYRPVLHPSAEAALNDRTSDLPLTSV